MVRKQTFWNSTRGTFEMAAHRSIKAADIDPEDELAARTVLALSITLDHLLKSHGTTLAGMVDYGDNKLAYHVGRLTAELGRAMDRCLLTPQSRIPLKVTLEEFDPFTTAMDNVSSILRD